MFFKNKGFGVYNEYSLESFADAPLFALQFETPQKKDQTTGQDRLENLSVTKNKNPDTQKRGPHKH